MVTYRLADVFDIIYIISFSKQTDLLRKCLNLRRIINTNQ